MQKGTYEPYISVVTPVYGSQLDLKTLYTRLVDSISKITNKFELIMINDASPDDAWDVIQNLAKNDERVCGINLSRNFGQHQAIAAGLEYVKGDWCVVMDCDLQDRPEEIEKLYKKTLEGYDIVVGKRMNRKDSFFKRITSKLFYIVFNYLTKKKLDNKVANFGIYSKNVIDAIKSFKEKDRSFGLLAIWVGFKRAEIEIKHGDRGVGGSGYNFRKRMDMAVNHILSHSDRPLKLSIKLGLMISFLSLFYAVFLICRVLLLGTNVAGWASVMVSLFFLSGLMMMIMGMVGLYVGKIYEEVKKRPLYIISDKTFQS